MSRPYKPSYKTSQPNPGGWITLLIIIVVACALCWPITRTARPPTARGPAPAALASSRDGRGPAGRGRHGDELGRPRGRPVDLSAREKLEVAFPQLSPGTRIGTVELVAPWTDARGTEIPAGTYAVRYALRPNDGNHMGASDFRDFLVLIPVSDDPGAGAKPEHEELMALGKKATGGRHPAVMGLAPAPEADMKLHVGELVVGVLLKNEGDH